MIYCNKNCLYMKDGECSKADCSFLGAFTNECPYLISLNTEKFEQIKDPEHLKEFDSIGDVFDHASLR